MKRFFLKSVALSCLMASHSLWAGGSQGEYHDDVSLDFPGSNGMSSPFRASTSPLTTREEASPSPLSQEASRSPMSSRQRRARFSWHERLSGAIDNYLAQGLDHKQMRPLIWNDLDALEKAFFLGGCKGQAFSNSLSGRIRFNLRAHKEKLASGALMDAMGSELGLGLPLDFQYSQKRGNYLKWRKEFKNQMREILKGNKNENTAMAWDLLNEEEKSRFAGPSDKVFVSRMSQLVRRLRIVEKFQQTPGAEEERMGTSGQEKKIFLLPPPLEANEDLLDLSLSENVSTFESLGDHRAQDLVVTERPLLLLNSLSEAPSSVEFMAADVLVNLSELHLFDVISRSSREKRKVSTPERHKLYMGSKITRKAVKAIQWGEGRKILMVQHMTSDLEENCLFAWGLLSDAEKAQFTGPMDQIFKRRVIKQIALKHPRHSAEVQKNSGGEPGVFFEGDLLCLEPPLDNF